jgi:hypothetical protein
MLLARGPSAATQPAPAAVAPQPVVPAAAPAGAVSTVAAAPGAAPGPDVMQTMEHAGSIYRDIAAQQNTPQALPAGAGAVIPVDHQAERNAQFDEETLRQNAQRIGGRGAEALLKTADAMMQTRTGAVTAAADRQARGDNIAAHEQGEDRRNATTVAGATQVAKARIDAEAPGRVLENAERAVKTRGAVSTMQAQDRYRAALASGDATKIKQAEDDLRAVQGKWEKPANFSAVSINGGIDPTTGMPVGAGMGIVNHNTGEYKIVSPQQVKAGGAAAPPAPAKGAVQNGYRFKGGNPADRNSWEKV